MVISFIEWWNSNWRIIRKERRDNSHEAKYAESNIQNFQVNKEEDIKKYKISSTSTVKWFNTTIYTKAKKKKKKKT